MKKYTAHLTAALLAIAATLCTPVLADDIQPIADVLKTTGNAGVGTALRLSGSPYLGASSRADLLPLALYEGERGFLRANRAGAKLFGEDATGSSRSNGLRLDIFLERRLEGFTSEKPPTSLAGMASREPGADLGLAYQLRQSWGTLRAELSRDIGSASAGYEMRLGYSDELRSGRWTLRPDASVSWRDAKLNNYYYGVRPSEAATHRAAYAPGAGPQVQLGLHSTYDLSERWRLLAGVSATVLSTAVKNSPIVDKQILPSAYLGAVYDFDSYKRPLGEAKTPTYVKLLYGKATEDSCHLARIITARCLSTAKVNPTNIVGVQLGRPFSQGFNGLPLDFTGYLGLAYHDERGLQANGAQIDAFMKASYYGFPWRERVKTRLGLGVGLSAAQRVPYIEVASQKAKATSKLLLHLDPTIDFSLGDVFASRAMTETYLGIGVSHRSGIFGASRLLGNVGGGSNYIYSYVETAF